MMSTNGIQWSEQTVPTDLPLFGVTYGAGQFVAVGNFGCVLVSQDGITWELADAGETNHLHKIVFGNGTFVALNDAGRTLYVSSNGRDWQVTTNDFGQLYDLFFGGDRFVAVGQNLQSFILISTDGRSWEKRDAPGGPALTGTFVNDVLYLFSPGSFGPPYVFSSTNLTDWQALPMTGVFSWLGSVIYLGQRFIGFAHGYIQTSLDSVNWVGVSSYPVSASFWTVSYGMDTYVAVGDSGRIVVSTNAVDWKLVAGICPILNVARGNHITVGIGYTDVYSSTNDSHFVLRITKTNSASAVAFSDGLFSVSAGGLGPVTAFVSSDGISWFDSLRTGPLLSISLQNSADPRISVAGIWGQIYLLQSTKDFIGWSPLGTTTNSSGIGSLVISNFGDINSLMIRAVGSN